MTSQTLELYNIIAQIPNGYVLMNKNSDDVAVYKTVVSRINFDQQQKIMSERFKLINQNLLKIIDYSFLDSPDPSYTVISIIYDGWNMDLEEDIFSRQQSKKYFTNEQMKSLVLGAINGLSCLHEKNLIHGDIKANNMAYNEKQDLIKIVDQFGFGGLFFKPSSQILQEKQSYLSPEIFIRIESQEEFYSTKENDIFALGLVFLEAATLQSCYDIYDWEKRILDIYQIKEKLQFVKYHYQESFYQLIAMMCEPDPVRRVDIQELREMIQVYFLNPNMPENARTTTENSQGKAKVTYHQSSFGSLQNNPQTMNIDFNDCNNDNKNIFSSRMNDKFSSTALTKISGQGQSNREMINLSNILDKCLVETKSLIDQNKSRKLNRSNIVSSQQKLNIEGLVQNTFQNNQLESSMYLKSQQSQPNQQNIEKENIQANNIDNKKYDFKNQKGKIQSKEEQYLKQEQDDNAQNNINLSPIKICENINWKWCFMGQFDI